MNRPSLPFPITALAQHLIALGKTRSGKSSKLRVVVEYLLDEAKPVCIIDPKGDWWGLKSSASGKASGYPIVIFGGEHADVPINEHSGAHIAELVATGNRSCLIDLGGWTVGARTRFFIDFSSTLFKLTKGTRYLAIDEVHNFCPKGRIFDADAGKMLHWANRLASEGQGKGLVLLAASQRPQKVHNDFLTSCETLIACKVIHKADRDAIKDWIDGCADPEIGRRVITEIAGLKKPEAWVWSPEIDFGPAQITWPLFRTYDSFKPQDPDVGELKGWATVDLEDVKAKLANVVQEAEANDPNKLKARIAKLEHAAKVKPPNLVENTALRTALTDAQQQVDTLEAANRALERNRDALSEALDAARNTIAAIRDRAEGLLATSVPFTDEIKKPSTPAPAAAAHGPVKPNRPAATPAPRPAATSTTGLNKAQHAVLRALWWLRDEERTAEKVAFYAGYSISSSTWDKAIGALRSARLVEALGVTSSGEALIAHVAGEKPTGTELREWLRQKLNKAENAFLDALVWAEGARLTNDELARRAGYSTESSTFDKAIGALRTIGAAEGYERDGGVRASDVFLA